jgi:hypothetical protein
MNLQSTIARVFAAVDRSLRKEFLLDYDRRCMYAAFGTCALLQNAGIEANIVGGDFVAFVVSTSGQRAGFQGFGSGENEPSHFWVEAENIIVDIGPHYLPKGSSFPAAPLPLISWPDTSSLPKFLRYRPSIRYHSSAQLLSTPMIIDRVQSFVVHCQDRFGRQIGQPKLPHWILAGPESMEVAARGGDFWAQNAMRFVREFGETQSLPF